MPVLNLWNLSKHSLQSSALPAEPSEWCCIEFQIQLLCTIRGCCFRKSLCLHIHWTSTVSVIRYDEEQAQSENAERDLRSRSGQSLGSKGTKGSAGVRPTAATWKWSDNFSLKFASCTTLQGPSVVNHLDFFFFLAHWTDAPSVQISLTVAQGAMALLLSGEKSAMCSHWEGWKACVCHCLYECKTK